MKSPESVTRRKRGRPLKEAPFQTRIYVRYQPAEKEMVVAQAQHAGLTTSEYVRRRSLGQRIVSRTDDLVLNELRRLGGLQKKLMTDAPEYRHELNAILHEILQVIKRMDSDVPVGGQ